MRSLPGVWWFAEVWPSAEDRAAGEFRRVGAEVLPLKNRIVERKTTANNNRYTETRWEPLFEGYLFFKATKEQRYSSQVARARCGEIHEINDQERITLELAQVQLALAVCPNLGKVEFRGDERVEVVCGVLRGLTGFVVNGRQDRLVLSVSMMGQWPMVEVNAADVEPI